MAWLPDDLSPRDCAPWETDVNFPSPTSGPAADIDAETKAFVAEMDDRWDERRAAKKQQERSRHSVEQVEGKDRKAAADDYRLRKQRIHAGLWLKEIEKMEESKLGDSSASDDIDRLLDSCAEIFDVGNTDFNESKVPSTSEFKTKPDGWSRQTRRRMGCMGYIPEEEDILVQGV
ncbi:hypothetical protein HPP92_016300 [Vanilla planifolia]|nr:hypothetical protein HPP92_016300 [Vanilla planifolia]